MPFFASFDEAWGWFVGGGELVTMEDQRASFTEGRAQYLAFVALVRDAGAIDLALDVQEELADIEGLAMMSEESLHVTIRGAGFQVIEKHRPDDVLRQDVPRIAERAARAIETTEVIEAQIGPANVFPDALILEVHDDGAFAAVRERLAGISAQDASVVAEAPYLPHITIAMFHTANVAAELRARLPALRERQRLAATLRRIELGRAWFTGVEAETPEIDVVRSYALRG